MIPGSTSRDAPSKLSGDTIILECSDRQFLPQAMAKQVDGDGRSRVQQRFLELKRLVELR